jgi:hypothetical protein
MVDCFVIRVLPRKLGEWSRPVGQRAIEVRLNAPSNETNKWRGVAVPVVAALGLAYDHLKKHVLNARRRSAARAQGLRSVAADPIGLTHLRDRSVVLPC